MIQRLFYISILSFFSYANGGVENFVGKIIFPNLDIGSPVSNFTEKSNFVRNSFDSQYSPFTPKSQLVVDQSSIEKKLADCLSFRFQANGEMGVSLARQWSPVELGENYNIKIISCSPDELVSNAFVTFEIWTEGKLFDKFSYPVRLSLLEEVYYTRLPILRGVGAKKELFDSRRVDTLKHHANSVPITTNLSSYEVNTNLRPDSPLKWNFLSKVTLVKKGSLVDVFASGNGIYLTMKGVALEDGVEGEQVRIRNLSSEKEFHAKVLNANSVKVYL